MNRCTAKIKMFIRFVLKSINLCLVCLFSFSFLGWSCSPAAFPSFIVLIDFLNMPLSIKQGTLLTVSSVWDKLFLSHANCVEKFLIITFPSYFFIFITDCQDTIIFVHSSSIISWLVLTICFAILSTLHFICQHNVSTSFPFCCTFCLVNSPSSLFLCSHILFHTCVSLFPLLQWFELLTNTNTNIIPPPCF